MWRFPADEERGAAPDAGARTEVLGTEALIAALQARAQAAVDAGSAVRTLAVRSPAPVRHTQGPMTGPVVRTVGVSGKRKTKQQSSLRTQAGHNIV